MTHRPAGRAIGRLLALLAAVCAAGCGPAPAREPAQLAARLFHASHLEIELVGAGEPSLRAECERLAERWSVGRNQAARAFETRVLAAGERGSRRAPRVLVGGPDAPELAPILARLGVQPDGRGGFRYLDRGFLSEHSLVATFEDPSRPGQPLTLVLGSDADELARRLARLEPVGWPGARAFRGGEPVLELRLGLAGGAQRATLVDRAAARRALSGRSRPLPGAPEGLEVLVAPGVDLRRLGALLSSVERVRTDAHTRLRAAGFEPRPDPWRLSLLGSPADFVRGFGRVELALAQPASGLVTMLVSAGVADDGGAAFGAALLEAALGAPRDAWLAEAAGVELADTWWGRGLAEWGAHLVDGALVPSALALCDPSLDARLSPHVTVPGRALLVRFLRAELGERGFCAWWRGEFGADLAPEERGRRRAQVLEGFELWLGAYLQPALAASRARRAEGRAAFEGRGLRRGVALDSRPAPGGNQLHGDLGASLDQARAAGADALSQLAYFVEHPVEARFAGQVGLPRLGPLEGDATIARSLGLARERGLSTLLRPVLLISDSGSLSGWARRTRLEEWARHFEAREAALLHAALLAELCGAEALSVGEDEGDAGRTLAGPPGERRPEVLEFKRARWEAAIALVRRVFSGGLTFLAAFPQEAETLALWEHLDLVGILFQPQIEAATAEGPDAAGVRDALRSQLARAAFLARERGRPLLIGEVAFRSTREAWRDPELGFGPLDPERQAQLFEAFAEALRSTQAQFTDLAGHYVWGWGPDPGVGGIDDRGFSPQNKPAAAQLFR